MFKKILFTLLALILAISFMHLSNRDEQTYKTMDNPGKYKTLQRIVEMPKGDKAFEDIEVTISLVQYDAVNNHYETKAVIPKGQSSAKFEISVPEYKNAYYAYYEIPIPIDLMGNIKYNSNTISLYYFTNTAYLGNGKMTPLYDEKTRILLDKTDSIHLALLAEEDIQTKAKDIISTIIEDEMSPYEKELAVYTYVTQNIKYDFSLINKKVDKDDPKGSNLLRMALIENRAVCAGHSMVMKLLLEMAGVECELIAGELGGPHLWNIVKLDNQYY